MRDPERRERILAYIATVWQEYPDMRLGQLLTNCGDFSMSQVRLMEDEYLERKLHECYDPLRSNA